ncbi:MAG: sulfotransferase [Rubrobacter sp.]
MSSRGAASSLNDGASIFFMVGAPKSGTTWLRRMLDQHPEVLCHGEGRFFGRDDKDMNYEKVRVNKKGQLLRPGSLHYTLAQSEDLRAWLERTWWSRDGEAEEHITHLTREAVLYFLLRKHAKIGKKIVGDKTPLHSTATLNEIGTMFPEARVVHIIRDGRDQAVSHNHHRWNRVPSVEEGGRLTLEEQDKRDRYRKDPEGFLASGESIFSEEYLVAAATGWSSKVGAAHREGPSVLKDGYTEVYYEDLLECPEEEMKRLFRFLGAGDEERVVHQCVESNRFEKVARRQAGSEDSGSFLRKGVAGDWRNVFTERDKAIYKEFAGDLLVEMNYEQDDNW